MKELSEDLVKWFFLDVFLKRDIKGYEMLMVIDKVKKIFGYELCYIWCFVLNNDGLFKVLLEDQFLLFKI